MTWPERRLLDMLRIEHPIILAPMAGFTTAALAASVCAAGGLGSIGCAGLPPDAVRDLIGQVRALTTRPLNVNFFCHDAVPADPHSETAWHDRLAPYYRAAGLEPPSSHPSSRQAAAVSPFDEAMCAVVEATRPEVVSFHFGLPAPSLLTRVKAAGCRVMSSATTVREARWLEEHGADVIIAQGYEAGGHRGMFLAADIAREVVAQPGTMALVPQIVDAVGVPVVAAGGLADGRSIAAAFALGAAGVQLGTAYLLCPEAGTSPLHRDALRNAGADATVVTKAFTGRPARALANRFTREASGFAADAPPFPFAMAAVAPLRMEAERRGSVDFTPLWSGQTAALAKAMPGDALTRSLAEDALQRLHRPG